MRVLTGRDAIEEIRAGRRQMSVECRHDPKELIRLLKLYDAKYARQVRMYVSPRRRERQLARPA